MNASTPLHGPAGADWRENTGVLEEPAFAEGHEPFPRDPRCPTRSTEEMALGFCGFLTADIPELHQVHPQRLADSWERFKARAEELGSFFAANGEG